MNNAPSQILEKEWISCGVTVFTRVPFAPQLQVCVCRAKIPTRPPLASLALQNGVFSQHTTVRTGRKTGLIVNSDVVFVGPALYNVHSLSLPWTSVIFISGCWGQCPCVLPVFCPFILERGCEGQTAPSFLWFIWAVAHQHRRSIRSLQIIIIIMFISR